MSRASFAAALAARRPGGAGPRVRLAAPGDVPALAALLRQLFALEADFAPDAARQAAGLRLLLQAEAAAVLVAEVEGAGVVGMVTVQALISTAEGAPVGLVEDVVVDEMYRGRGELDNLSDTQRDFTEPLHCR